MIGRVHYLGVRICACIDITLYMIGQVHYLGVCICACIDTTVYMIGRVHYLGVCICACIDITVYMIGRVYCQVTVRVCYQIGLIRVSGLIDMYLLSTNRYVFIID